MPGLLVAGGRLMVPESSAKAGVATTVRHHAGEADGDRKYSWRNNNKPKKDF
jgi:hypothetical protein